MKSYFQKKYENYEASPSKDFLGDIMEKVNESNEAPEAQSSKARPYFLYISLIALFIATILFFIIRNREHTPAKKLPESIEAVERTDTVEKSPAAIQQQTSEDDINNRLQKQQPSLTRENTKKTTIPAVNSKPPVTQADTTIAKHQELSMEHKIDSSDNSPDPEIQRTQENVVQNSPTTENSTTTKNKSASSFMDSIRNATNAENDLFKYKKELKKEKDH